MSTAVRMSDIVTLYGGFLWVLRELKRTRKHVVLRRRFVSDLIVLFRRVIVDGERWEGELFDGSSIF